MATVYFNISTKISKFTVKDSLFIGTTDVLTTLNSKASTTELNLKANALNPTFTGTLNANQLLFNNTSVGMPTITARSIGTKLILYDLLTSSNGFTDYGIGTEPNHMWFTIGGSTVATNGGYKFYTNTNNIATIKGNGDFNCSGITCSALNIGSVNVLTELNDKLSITNVYTKEQSDTRYTPKIDTYTSPLRIGLDPITFKTDLRIDPTMDLNITNINAKQLTALNNLSTGQNVMITAENSGQGGFSSLYL